MHVKITITLTRQRKPVSHASSVGCESNDYGFSTCEGDFRRTYTHTAHNELRLPHSHSLLTFTGEFSLRLQNSHTLELTRTKMTQRHEIKLHDFLCVQHTILLMGLSITFAYRLYIIRIILILQYITNVSRLSSIKYICCIIVRIIIMSLMYN